MHWGEMAWKGGVPPDRVLDAMRLAKLLRHLRRRRQTASRAALVGQGRPYHQSWHSSHCKSLIDCGLRLSALMAGSAMSQARRGAPRGHSSVSSQAEDMSRAIKTTLGPELTLEERRERRRLRREKQREDNVHRAAKMHAARLKMEATSLKATAEPKASLYVGCSGWRYWKWRDSFYAGVPQPEWFKHYLKRFDTVEINASFYSWPTVANVQAWRRGLGKKRFVFTVKVCELITHVKEFKGTKTLVKDFGMIADILGDQMGCFLFQPPPSYRYTKVRLNDIVSQLDPSRRNVAEFRHASWWNEEVYSAFREAGIIFCSCSAPRLPDELIRTTDEVYVRMHGPKRWYRHDYAKQELADWATKIKDSGAKRAWVYFNNDHDAHAPKNAAVLRRMLRRERGFR
jgi:uncharacterized protein YecE (DUF72 family)